MKRKILRVPFELLPYLFASTNDRNVIFDGWPDDARVIDARRSNIWDGSPKLDILVESSTFDDVPNGTMYPEFVVTAKRVEVLNDLGIDVMDLDVLRMIRTKIDERIYDLEYKR